MEIRKTYKEKTRTLEKQDLKLRCRNQRAQVGWISLLSSKIQGNKVQYLMTVQIWNIVLNPRLQRHWKKQEAWMWKNELIINYH